MVIVNKLNKMVQCIFMDGITVKKAAKVFYIHICKNHGFFNIIIFDRGRTFINYFWDQLVTELGIKTDFSTAYHPETDGQTEILNSIFEQYLRVYVSFCKIIGLFGYFQPKSLLTTTFPKPPNAFILINSKQHFKMGLKPDPFVNKFYGLPKKRIVR